MSSTSRRSLLAGLGAGLALAAPAMAAPAPALAQGDAASPDLAALWAQLAREDAELVRLDEWIDSELDGFVSDETDRAFEAVEDRVDAIATEIMVHPACTMGDVDVKMATARYWLARDADLAFIRVCVSVFVAMDAIRPPSALVGALAPVRCVVPQRSPEMMRIDAIG